MFQKLMETQASSGQSWWVLIIYIVIIGAAMYFILIRPQRKKQKDEKRMLDATQIGDEILTIGGIYGKIIAVKEESYIIETGPDRVKMRVAKWAMQQNFTERAVPEEKKEKKEKKSKPQEK